MDVSRATKQPRVKRALLFLYLLFLLSLSLSLSTA